VTSSATTGWSSGRRGNRQINRVPHTTARVQLRTPTEGRAYYDRKKTDGKAPMEAMRCVKRRLSDIVFQTMLNALTGRSGGGVS
jgi:transposase